jgi:hypothetical protein
MPLKDPEARRAYHREYMRGWYQRNREVHITRTARRGRRAREIFRQYVNAYKSQPCLDCGGQFPPFVMDFDHVRDTKIAIVSRLGGGRAALSKLEAEIAKCDVVCSNCHRLRTQLRLHGDEVKPNEVVQRLGPSYVSVMVYG